MDANTNREIRNALRTEILRKEREGAQGDKNVRDYRSFLQAIETTLLVGRFPEDRIRCILRHNPFRQMSIGDREAREFAVTLLSNLRVIDIKRDKIRG